jgi:hypothetical protein
MKLRGALLASVLLLGSAGQLVAQDAPSSQESIVQIDGKPYRVVRRTSPSPEEMEPPAADGSGAATLGVPSRDVTIHASSDSAAALGTPRFETSSLAIDPQAPAADAAANACDSCHRDRAHCSCHLSWGAFIDWLYLTPRGADLGFSVPTNACFGPPLAPIDQLDFDFESGLRYGLSVALTPGESWLAFTGMNLEFDTSVTNRGTLAPTLLVSPNVAGGTVSGPSPTLCDAAISTLAKGRGGIDADTWDLDYVCLSQCCNVDLLWSVGVRVASLDQAVTAIYDQDTVLAASDLRGAGVRGGLGAVKHCGCWQFFGKTGLSLLASDIDLGYDQFNIFEGQVVRFRQDTERVVPVLDLEIGAGIDITKNISFSIGYMYQIWWNVVTDAELIQALQAADFSGDVEDDLSFDGFFARIEVKF